MHGAATAAAAEPAAAKPRPAAPVVRGAAAGRERRISREAAMRLLGAQPRGRGLSTPPAGFFRRQTFAQDKVGADRFHCGVERLSQIDLPNL